MTKHIKGGAMAVKKHVWSEPLWWLTFLFHTVNITASNLIFNWLKQWKNFLLMNCEIAMHSELQVHRVWVSLLTDIFSYNLTTVFKRESTVTLLLNRILFDKYTIFFYKREKRIKYFFQKKVFVTLSHWMILYTIIFLVYCIRFGDLNSNWDFIYTHFFTTTK